MFPSEDKKIYSKTLLKSNFSFLNPWSMNCFKFFGKMKTVPMYRFAVWQQTIKFRLKKFDLLYQKFIAKFSELGLDSKNQSDVSKNCLKVK